MATSTSNTTIDLKKEQQSSLARETYQYSWIAKIFFFGMDLVTGRKTTLAKAKLLEILATVPYRAWEFRQYRRLTREYHDTMAVKKAQYIKEWGRDAQDNEYWHLLVLNEKMKEDNLKDPWFLHPLFVYFVVTSYRIVARVYARFNISRAFLFNAEFEDHAEHIYAQFVEDHPEWDTQPVRSELVKEYGEFDNWGDVFRRIGLDERDHRNESLMRVGKADQVAKYEGMPNMVATI